MECLPLFPDLRIAPHDMVFTSSIDAWTAEVALKEWINNKLWHLRPIQEWISYSMFNYLGL